MQQRDGELREQAEVVVQGHPVAEGVAGAAQPGMGAQPRNVGEDAGMAEHHTLRCAGRAGAVLQQSQRVR